MPDLKDASSPKLIKQLGGYHPINQIKDSIMNLISSFGFEIINGPEIETEEFNFDMLNIKKSCLYGCTLYSKLFTLFLAKMFK